jgi:hypothetical protein
MTLQKLCGALALIVGSTALGAVERVDYADTGSNVQKRRAESEQRGFEVSSSSFAAFGIVPALEWPAADYEIDGFRFNLFAGEHVDVYGFDLGVFGNFVKREVGGLQIAGLFNVVGESDGALQIAAVCNYCKGDFGGVQVGLVNVTEKGRGLQLGLVNRANILYGVQIGLANFIDASSVRFFPIVNCAF